MTLVTITLTVPDGQVGDPEAPAVGYQQWKAVGPGARRRAESPAREVLPAPFRVDLLPGVTTVEVAPTSASWVWLVCEYVDGAGTSVRAIAVPDQPTIEYRDCPQVDTRTLKVVGPAPDPVWVQQLAALTDEIASAQSRATEAAASAASAATSASGASASATNATNAANSATSASASASASATTATNAATSAIASADAAALSESAASGSASTASTQAGIATTKAGEAAASATAAAGSAASASGSATTATAKAAEAASSASAADASATAAASSAATASAAQAATEAVDITVGTVTTGAAGSSASASITGEAPAFTLDLTIPRGAPGPANSLAIGTVTTGAAGSSASASITGTAPEQTLNLTIPRGEAGSPTAYELRGTGMPNGVVTAPPGTYYTDTAGTNGAWRWLKKSGTGTTGWECIAGDTGWRNVAATHLADGWQLGGTGRLLVRRANAQVSVAVRVSVAAGAGFIGTNRTIRRDLLKSFPVGFRQSWQVSFATAARVNVTTMGILTNGGITGGLDATGLSGNWAANDEFVAEPTWVTQDAWPTTLPGTAV